ncbi:prepilin-type N-terminal cleavage/methylation domain-containing protein [Sporosarcina sp. Marseille-Q4943]|uniref:type IV pilus modification PilV family protein n=1 Tax=Sporosarcina sp. Marseille-Q4943 TaxID=2942204 RepID=UPI00208DCC4A|nr:prepilin-type N-terminal cleavage/methylation domain-containing protein [Sporosarcina sp. Marseille-Q4943]
MRSDKINEKGMTLVEILAALVIFGIVFIGFMTIFPQMTNFNEKTGSKLETMNLARNKLDQIRGSGLPSQCDGASGKCLITDEENGYKVTLEYTMEPDLKPQGNLPGQVTLHQVHIKYFRPGQKDKPISETFGYVRD